MLGKKDFETTFHLYYDSLCKYLYLFTNDFSLIEDIIQTVFIKLWEDRENIHSSNLKSYLYTAVRSRILNAIRDRKKRENLLANFYRDELINNEADEIIDYNEFHDIVQAFINKLPKQTQTIYKLSRNENLKYKEISKSLNISVKTVEKHISIALSYLHENIKRHYTSLKIFILFICFIFFEKT